MADDFPRDIHQQSFVEDPGSLGHTPQSHPDSIFPSLPLDCWGHTSGFFHDPSTHLHGSQIHNLAPHHPDDPTLSLTGWEYLPNHNQSPTLIPFVPCFGQGCSDTRDAESWTRVDNALADWQVVSLQGPTTPDLEVVWLSS
jgi:hypothetical protein